MADSMLSRDDNMDVLKGHDWFVARSVDRQSHRARLGPRAAPLDQDRVRGPIHICGFSQETGVRKTAGGDGAAYRFGRTRLRSPA
jgi:hypothetical protein